MFWRRATTDDVLLRVNIYDIFIDNYIKVKKFCTMKDIRVAKRCPRPFANSQWSELLASSRPWRSTGQAKHACKYAGKYACKFSGNNFLFIASKRESRGLLRDLLAPIRGRAADVRTYSQKKSNWP